MTKLGSLKRPPLSPSQALLKDQLKNNRPVSKRIFLNPLFVMALLCVGVFIAGWTYRAVADYYSVAAVVPATNLGQGAVITYPTYGQVLTTSPITVTGTCPVGSYVNLSRNGTFSGTAWCSAQNTFSIVTDLFLGQNNLEAQDYNQANVPGPITPTVVVTYQPKPTTTTPSAASKPLPLLNIPALLLTSQFHFATYPVDKPYTWSLQVSGGQSPYYVTVAWGDGSQSSLNLSQSGTFNINHHYGQSGYYSVLVSAHDLSGQNAHLQLSALIRTNRGYILAPGGYCLLATGSSNCQPPPHQNFMAFIKLKAGWLLFAWPPFLIVLLMLISFWLGEREEINREHRTKLRHP